MKTTVTIDPAVYDQIFQKFLRSPISCSREAINMIFRTAEEQGIQFVKDDIILPARGQSVSERYSSRIQIHYDDIVLDVKSQSTECAVLYCLKVFAGYDVESLIELYSL